VVGGCPIAAAFFLTGAGAGRGARRKEGRFREDCCTGDRARIKGWRQEDKVSKTGHGKIRRGQGEEGIAECEAGVGHAGGSSVCEQDNRGLPLD
jgi:hypothetical protein